MTAAGDDRAAREYARKVAAEAAALRRALDDVARGNTAKRRRVVLFLTAGIFVTAWLVDAHVETCSPYVREQKAPISALRAAVCDVTSPMHAHGPTPWASPANVAGLLLYGAAAAGGIRWYKRALRAPDDGLDA